MREKPNERHFGWFTLLMAVIIAYFASVLISQQVHLNQVARDYEAAQVRLQEAEDIHEHLTKEKEALTNEANVEKIAREELGMTRKGELPYIAGHRQ